MLTQRNRTADSSETCSRKNSCAFNKNIQELKDKSDESQTKVKRKSDESDESQSS